MNQFHVDFITKDCKRHYKVGQLKEQVLQTRTGITKQGNFYLKVGNNYKVMQYRRQMEETGEGNRFWQLTPLFTQHFTPKIS